MTAIDIKASKSSSAGDDRQKDKSSSSLSGHDKHQHYGTINQAEDIQDSTLDKNADGRTYGYEYCTVPSDEDMAKKTIEYHQHRPNKPTRNYSIEANKTKFKYDVDLNALVDESGQPIIHFRDTDGSRNQDIRVKIAMYGSFLVNIALLVGKLYSAIIARSLAVAASTVDSFLDLFSLLVVWLAQKSSEIFDPATYPVGKGRLQTLGLILGSAMMGFASVQLIIESVETILKSLNKPHKAAVHFDAVAIAVLAATILLKTILYVYCKFYAPRNPTTIALAQDHFNDVLSNIVAIGTALFTNLINQLWWLDACGAIIISIYVACRWFDIGREQAEYLIGKTASQEFIDAITQVAQTYHPDIYPSAVISYHFGEDVIVELKVVLPAKLTIFESHDMWCVTANFSSYVVYKTDSWKQRLTGHTLLRVHILLCIAFIAFSLELQQLVEYVDEVERCFVHVDYDVIPEDEHGSGVLKKVHPFIIQEIKNRFPKVKPSQETGGSGSSLTTSLVPT